MTTFVVHKKAVIENIRRIKERAGRRTIYAVLKSNGYGLGLDWMAKTLIEHGINHFAVTEFRDAIRLRDLSEDTAILLLNPVASAEQLDVAAGRHITVTISSAGQAELINDYCRSHAAFVNAHIVIDTGMGRYGFIPEEIAQIARIYEAFPGIKVEGVYSHIYNALNRKSTKKQIAQFSGLLQALKEAGITPGIAHIASSVVLFDYPEALFDAVRIGSAFTGRLVTKDKHGLVNAGVVESAVSEMRTLKKGQNVGYGGVFRVRRETRAAVIDAGYLSGIGLDKKSDVFRLRDFIVNVLSGFKKIVYRQRYHVRVNGVTVPVLGRIGANHLVADVTGIDCCIGAKVTMEGNPMICGNLSCIEYRQDPPAVPLSKDGQENPAVTAVSGRYGSDISFVYLSPAQRGCDDKTVHIVAGDGTVPR